MLARGGAGTARSGRRPSRMPAGVRGRRCRRSWPAREARPGWGRGRLV